MSQAQTIAIVGSTPFAWLLAGLLADDHSRAVVLICEPPDPLRLWPALSLSAAPVTRRETWSLLADLVPITARRLAHIAPRSIRRADMRFLARSTVSKIALSHIRHMMAGFKFPVEPEPVLGGQTQLLMRDMWSFSAARFMAVAPDWLVAANVAVVHSAQGLKLNKDGTARFGATDVDMVVLADDEAVLARLTPTEVSVLGTIQSRLGLSMRPAGAAGQPINVDLDTGAIALRRETGHWLGSAPDEDGKGEVRIANALPDGVAPRRDGRVSAARILTHDGAPALGRPRRHRPHVICGLGPLDIVFAPLLARLIAGEGSGFEAEWAAAHGADRVQPRADVAEFMAASGEVGA